MGWDILIRGYVCCDRIKYYLQELELLCTEDHVPGSVACSGFDAKVVNKLALERMVIKIASNPIKKHKRTRLRGVFCDVLCVIFCDVETNTSLK